MIHPPRIASLLAAAAVAAATIGCAGGQVGYLQVRPERLYERRPLDDAHVERVGKMDFERRTFAIFGIPFSSPNIVAAIDSEIQDNNADAVANLQIASRLQVVLYLVANTVYHVTGDLVRYDKRREQ